MEVVQKRATKVLTFDSSALQLLRDGTCGVGHPVHGILSCRNSLPDLTNHMGRGVQRTARVGSAGIKHVLCKKGILMRACWQM